MDIPTPLLRVPAGTAVAGVSASVCRVKRARALRAAPTTLPEHDEVLRAAASVGRHGDCHGVVSLLAQYRESPRLLAVVQAALTAACRTGQTPCVHLLTRVWPIVAQRHAAASERGELPPPVPFACLAAAVARGHSDSVVHLTHLPAAWRPNVTPQEAPACAAAVTHAAHAGHGDVLLCMLQVYGEQGVTPQQQAQWVSLLTDTVLLVAPTKPHWASAGVQKRACCETLQLSLRRQWHIAARVQASKAKRKARDAARRLQKASEASEASAGLSEGSTAASTAASTAGPALL